MDRDFYNYQENRTLLASCGAIWPDSVKPGRRVPARRPAPIYVKQRAYSTEQALFATLPFGDAEFDTNRERKNQDLLITP
jgi:hypothetical protein